MTYYTIEFHDGRIVDGYARWDGESAEDLLIELGLTASEARQLGIKKMLPDRRPYVTHAEFRAREKERAA